jgi:RimJ/RimL family protein N-acetyltransferase
LIGRITLRDIDRGEARLGIYLHPQEIGKGFGREALAIFCSYIFRRVGLARLRLDVASDNRRAVACYRAVGFRTVDFIRRDEHAYLEMEHTSAVRVHTAC